MNQAQAQGIAPILGCNTYVKALPTRQQEALALDTGPDIHQPVSPSNSILNIVSLRSASEKPDPACAHCTPTTCSRKAPGMQAS